jgi:hypothetical protein
MIYQNESGEAVVDCIKSQTQNYPRGTDKNDRISISATDLQVALGVPFTVRSV